MNVDLLPISQEDPFCDLPGRLGRHFEQRMIFNSVLEACKLEVHSPEMITGSAAGDFAEMTTSIPIARVPTGDQAGTPSWIDHVVSDGCVHGYKIVWTDLVSKATMFIFPGTCSQNEFVP